MSFRKDFPIYLVSTALAAAVPILLMPVLSRALDPDDYGRMAMLVTLVSMLTPVINFGTVSYLGVACHQEDQAGLARVLSSILVIPPVMTGIVMLASLPLREAIGDWLSLPPVWITLAAPFTLAMTLPWLLLVLLRMRNRSRDYAVIEIGGAVLNFGLTALLLIGLGQGWLARGQAMALTGLMLSVLAVIWLRRMGLWGARRDSRVVRDALAFGSGLVPHEVASQAVRIADRVVIMTVLGAAAAGEYAVAAQIASLMLLVISAFNRAWTPFMFARLRENDPASDLRIIRVMRLAMAGIVVSWLLFVAVTPLLFRFLVDARYHGAIGPTIWISVGYLCMGVYATYIDVISYFKKTRYLSVVTACAMVLNIGLSYALVLRFGPSGAGMAFTATSAVMMVALLAVVRRLRPLPWAALFR